MSITISGNVSGVDKDEIRFRIQSLDDEQFRSLLLNWSSKDYVATESAYCIEFFSPDYKRQKEGKQGEVNFHTCSRTIRASTDFLKNLDAFVTIITTLNMGFNTV